MNLVELGSQTARNGFKNEYDVIDIFNNWKRSRLAKDWLRAMNYKIEDIEYVHAEKIMGNYKGDIQVQVTVTIKLKSLVDCQNISVKLVSKQEGFNQIDRGWVDKYGELWSIPDKVRTILKYYTGEILPYKKATKDSRRMFLTEMTEEEQCLVVKWIDDNKCLIANDILKGRGKFSAEWMLVTQKVGSTLKWALKPINEVVNFYLQGGVVISQRGNIHLGRITIQRKGGDGGRDTAKQLQFKINPIELFDL